MTSDDPGPGQKYAIMAIGNTSPPSGRKSQESKSRSDETSGATGGRRRRSSGQRGLGVGQ